MHIEQLLHSDLAFVKNLQPEGWPDIVPFIDFYIKSDFCSPVKCVVDNAMVGIGNVIFHRNTAWLAHIIVAREHRGKGIGKRITAALVKSIDRNRHKTILLIATQLGEPVYKRLGFEKEMEYVYLLDGQTQPLPNCTIIPFQQNFATAVFNFDKQVSGEDRQKLLKPHLNDATLIFRNNQVEGFYMPTLGEGLILAENPLVGRELLGYKHSTVKKAAIPALNKDGLTFLMNHGFIEKARGSRMWLGEPLKWQPEKLYGRIGGNLG